MIAENKKAAEAASRRNIIDFILYSDRYFRQSPHESGCGIYTFRFAASQARDRVWVKSGERR
jgi:hypothetical protein